MDRQAFRNRMQQLKQYREQNPGKTYLDFKKYAEGGEIPPNNKPIIPEEPQPLELPNVERLNSGNSRARMQRNSNGTYSYKLDPDIADISAPVTEHELSHYADFKRNLDRPDPHGDSNMFYQMKKDISGRKIDSRDDYYSLPTEQKAHMNQLREYMFQNNYISTRGEIVDEKLLKKAIQEADKLDSMRGVARASRQFKSFNKYTKWFNSIPLLGIGAAAVYNNNQEK